MSQADQLKKALSGRKGRGGLESVASSADGKAPEEQVVTFVALRNVTRKTDHFPAYCVEIAVMKGDKVLDRRIVSKRDLLEPTISKAEEILESGFYEEER